MMFKRSSLQLEFQGSHPKLVHLLTAFENYSFRARLPLPLLTQLWRNPDGQAIIYVGYWKRLREAYIKGPVYRIDPEGDGSYRDVTPAELVEAKEILAFTDEQLDERARKRFTWHWVRCAADMRTTGGVPHPHYTSVQMDIVRAWFEDQCQDKTLWELKIHDTHGPHLHVAYRDLDWRRRLDPRRQPSTK